MLSEKADGAAFKLSSEIPVFGEVAVGLESVIFIV